jgi:hypothetical protein
VDEGTVELRQAIEVELIEGFVIPMGHNWETRL